MYVQQASNRTINNIVQGIGEMVSPNKLQNLALQLLR
jgi:hypothetical protein